MQKQTAFGVGIDIGTAAVRCVVGVLGEDQIEPAVIGAGEAASHGLRKGCVINVEDAAQAVVSAITQAERIAGQRIDRATISVNGSHIIGLNSKGVIAISSNSREITFDDVERAEEAATVVQLPPNREILQVFAKSYHLDGQENIKDPIGMNGVRLEVDAHIVTAATPAVKNLDRVMEVAGVGIGHHILAGLAAAEATLEPKQRESGTVVIDIGAGTTNVIVFEEDDVQHIAVLPVGSVNLTNDLAIGLKTDLEVAEIVKLEHATATALTDKKKATIEMKYDGESYKFEREAVDMIVQARLNEIFELVDRELKKINRSQKLPGGAILVGGGAMLPEIDHFARERLQLPARVTKPKHYTGVIDATADPRFATAVGLMMLDLHMGAAGHGGHGQASFSPQSIMTSAKGLFDRFRP